LGASFVVHVDESGDEGLLTGEGSSEWFVLAGVVFPKAMELGTVKLVDQVRQELGRPPRKPLHFRKLKHEQRLPYVARIAAAALRTVAVLVHKPSIREPERFREGHRLYFYAVRLLLERISWYCRNNPRDEGDGCAEIVFSNRSDMPYEEMRDYLRLLEGMSDSPAAGISIYWEVIRPDRILTASHGKRMGLQIADAVAGSFWRAVERSAHGFTEDRYARMLRPVVYRHRAASRGYGIKLFPREADALVLGDERFGWWREVYGR